MIQNSYLPAKEPHSFQDPISSVTVSPDEKFCPIKILKLFSLPPTGIVHTLERLAQNTIFVCTYNVYAIHAISCTNLVALISSKYILIVWQWKHQLEAKSSA